MEFIKKLYQVQNIEMQLRTTTPTIPKNTEVVLDRECLYPQPFRN
jgi:hypothetical protein